MKPSSHLLLIAGCGYVGESLARRAMTAGWEALGITRSATSAESLRAGGVECIAADLTDRQDLSDIARKIEGREFSVVHCAAGGKGGGIDTYRQVYFTGMQLILETFPQARRVLFTSSSSVYAQIDGSVVTEDSLAEPGRGTGQILRETEDLARAAGGCVLRLAGLYGPGRSVLLRNFLEGKSTVAVRTETPATPDGRWVNQIHRDDAAGAMLHLLATVPDAKYRGALYNAADSTPLLQRTLYQALSARLDLPMPPDAPPDTGRKRGWTHKQVSNSLLRSAGWEPRFPSWLDALDHHGLSLAAPASGA